MSNTPSRTYWFIGGTAALLLCCCCFALMAGMAYIVLDEMEVSTADPVSPAVSESSSAQPVTSANQGLQSNDTPPPQPTITPVPLPPTPTPAPLAGLRPPPEIDQRPQPSLAADSLHYLWDMILPEHDYYELAITLGNEKDTGRALPLPQHTLNDTLTFEVDGAQVEATLMAANEVSHFWVADGVAVRKAEITAVADRFHNELYPAVLESFGTAWLPPGQPPITFLHIPNSSGDELGYFTSSDMYPATIFSDSNEKGMLYMNMGELEWGEELYYGTLVHELQHLIHWYYDGNETSWLDEGLAQLTEHLLGFDTFDVDDYTTQPNLQLNTWDNDNSYPHYAASALFAIYFYEQVGPTAVQALIAHPADGLTSVRAVLAQYHPERSLEQFLADWYVANYVRSAEFGPRYSYDYRFRTAQPDTVIRSRPWEEVTSMAQYGARYIDFDQPGEYTISFAGDTVVELLAITPPSGQRAWLSPGADGVNATLTAAFDLTSLRTATLEFWAWYELEEDYDFAYVMVSSNNGQSWRPLNIPNGSRGDYGSAFNGHSADQQGQKGGWVFYSLPLDEYAGQSIQVRFQLISDASVFERGFAVDDITIPQLGFVDDVEGDTTAVWFADGFVPTTTLIPQQWVVQWVEYGREPRVQTLPLDALNQGQFTLFVPESATLVISPMAPYTTHTANYWLKVE